MVNILWDRSTDKKLELTISMQEEEILVAPNHRIDVPCVVQWSILWFFSALATESKISWQWYKMYDIQRNYKSGNHSYFTAPYGGFNTPRACMLRSVHQTKIGTCAGK